MDSNRPRNVGKGEQIIQRVAGRTSGKLRCKGKGNYGQG